MSFSDIQRQWQAVLQPEVHADMAMAERVDLEIAPSISYETAWWLAQCCHVVYVKDTCRRQEILSRAGLVETASFTEQELHWSRIERGKADGLAIIAFRGSSDPRHWILNLSTLLVDDALGGKVHSGFQKAFQTVEAPLRKDLEEGPPKALFFTGHSLGGALALLASTRWPRSRAYTFGSPRVGNAAFAERASTAPVTRVIVGQDMVAALPEAMEELNDEAYCHCGIPLHLTPDGVATHREKVVEASAIQLLMGSFRSLLGGQIQLGAPVPALLDHAPASYVKALKACRDQEAVAPK